MVDQLSKVENYIMGLFKRNTATSLFVGMINSNVIETFHLENCIEPMESLIQKGYLKVDNNSLSLTKKGKEYIR